jgi:hypothetical protein
MNGLWRPLSRRCYAALLTVCSGWFVGRHHRSDPSTPQPQRGVELAYGRGIRRLHHAGDASASPQAVVDRSDTGWAQLAGAGRLQIGDQQR